MRYYLGPPELASKPYTHWKAPDRTLGWIDLRSQVGGCGFFVMPDDAVLTSDYRLFGAGDLRDIAPNESSRAVFASMLGLGTVSGDKLVDWLYTALSIHADPLGVVSAKPLMPTMAKHLEIHLGGHGFVKRAAFDLGSPEAQNSIRVMQETYREISRQDDRLARKALGFLGQKYGVADPERLFIPSDMPRVSALKPETTITESFTTADSDTLGPDLTWTEVAGDIDIVSNRAQVAPASITVLARADSDLSGTDHYAQAVCQIGSGDYPGTAVRKGSTSTMTYYSGRITTGADNHLIKLVAGAETKLGSSTAGNSASTDYTVKTTINGTTLTVHVDGGLVDTATDSAISTGVRCGICGFTQGAAKWDSFEAADLAAGGTAVPVFVHQLKRQGIA